MAAPRIRTDVHVMFFDTDCGGVVSNIAYLRFVEIARTHLAEELGLGLAEMAEKQTYPLVVRTEIDYRRAAKLGDRLVIRSEEHTSELQSQSNLVCRLLLEKKNKKNNILHSNFVIREIRAS